MLLSAITIMGLTLIDILVIVLYFVSVIMIGFWSMRRIKNQEDYFLAGRRFGKLVQTFAAFGQATSSSTAINATTTTMANGASGIWGSLSYIFGTPLFWLMSPWYRRLRLMTMADFFEDRYGSKRMAAGYALICVLGLMMLLGPGFSAMAKTIMALTPKAENELTAEEMKEYNRSVLRSQLQTMDYSSLTSSQRQTLHQLQVEKPRQFFSYSNKTMLIAIVALITLIYGVAGGLEAAYLSDVLQGIFIIILSVILLPFAYSRINHIYGGDSLMDAFRTMHQQLPESTFQLLGTPASIDFTWYYIFSIMVMMSITVAIQPNQMSAIASAKDEYTGRFGFTVGLFLKRICTLFWCMLALAGILLYGGKVDDPDKVWGYATLDLLGPLKMGLVGLMIACLAAALMSTASCLMITASSLVTRNVYKEIYPDRDEKHYVFVGRIAGALVVIGAAWLAIQFESVFELLKLSWEIFAIFAATFWLGMVWRRANRKAAWVSITLTLLVFFMLPTILPTLMPSLKTNPYLLKMTDPAPLERYYTARQMDVQQRLEEIQKWQVLSAQDKTADPSPAALESGQRFAKVYRLPPKSVFWQLGVKKQSNGQLAGQGMLNLELILLDKMGWELSRNPYALNETLRVLFRTIVPFLFLVVVGVMTKPEEKTMLDRFYAKMKTPVRVDRQLDGKELERSYADPALCRSRKLFPNSNWEFEKWNREDGWGFLISILVAVALVGALFVIVSIGG
jgi:SSS family solute:Na+ symporter